MVTESTFLCKILKNVKHNWILEAFKFGDRILGNGATSLATLFSLVTQYDRETAELTCIGTALNTCERPQNWNTTSQRQAVLECSL